MMKNRFFKIVIFLMMFLLSFSLYAEAKNYYQITIDRDIDATAWLDLKMGIMEAEKKASDAVILNLNTYGGLVLYADSM